MRPALSAVQHLALYSAFHRSAGNLALHAVCVPLIFLTGAVLLAYAGDRSHALLHAGTLAVTCCCILLARVDKVGAVALFAWLAPTCGLAGLAVRSAPSAWLLPLAAAVHALAWVLTVSVGHARLEPGVMLGGYTEDSNLYFRAGYFTAREIGCPVAPIDRLIQFCIAPLSLTHDALVSFGLRAAHDRRIVRQRELVLERLRSGQPPFAGRVSDASWRSIRSPSAG